MDAERYLKDRRRLIDKALDSCLPGENKSPSIIHRAMRYSVFSGGKRLRPIFAISACEACNGSINNIVSTACAIEIIHTYSLIHDDLPSMDNADMRRGKPSCHKKFGEAITVLAGDALLTFAFKLADARVIKDLCDAIGTDGMIGGQALEIQNSQMRNAECAASGEPRLWRGMRNEKKSARPATAGAPNPKSAIRNLKRISQMKTGALIATSIKVGGILGGANAQQVRALFNFGRCVGLAFQIIDDVFDKEGYALALGKPQAALYARRIITKGKRGLGGTGCKVDILKELADYVVNRKN